MSYENAPELYCEIDLPESQHGRVHLAQNAMADYALLPEDVSAMITPSSFRNASQKMPLEAEEKQPFVNIAITDPDTARRLAKATRPERQFFVKDGWFTALSKNVVNCVVTFDTSVKDTRDGQLVALDRFIPSEKRNAIQPSLRKDGLEVVLAEAIKKSVSDGVEHGLNEYEAEFGDTTDNGVELRKWRASGISNSVTAMFFGSNLPRLAEIKQDKYDGEE